MRNYLKIPVPKYSELLLPILNQIIQSDPEWDGVTLVEGIVVHSTSLDLKFYKPDGNDCSSSEIHKMYNLVAKLGVQYEYNR